LWLCAKCAETAHILTVTTRFDGGNVILSSRRGAERIIASIHAVEPGLVREALDRESSTWLARLRHIADGSTRPSLTKSSLAR
jgi:hypothetical protein